jgi:hypothetical protein
MNKKSGSEKRDILKHDKMTIRVSSTRIAFIANYLQ